MAMAAMTIRLCMGVINVLPWPMAVCMIFPVLCIRFHLVYALFIRNGERLVPVESKLLGQSL